MTNEHAEIRDLESRIQSLRDRLDDSGIFCGTKLSVDLHRRLSMLKTARGKGSKQSDLIAEAIKRLCDDENIKI
ncbi:MAG: hypothetical protein M1457_08540 [bacterium]|nr:hypothetical protein [bacterium]